MDNILNSIKTMLGIDDSNIDYDPELIIYINSCFSSLNQLGAGPKDGFMLIDGSENWDAFTSTSNLVSLCKVYIYLKLRTTWDIPSSSIVLGSLKEQLAEVEWRIVAFLENRLPSDSGDGSGSGTSDYELLQNLPKLDGKTIIGNMKETDPTIGEMTSSEVDEIFDNVFNSTEGSDSNA